MASTQLGRVQLLIMQVLWEKGRATAREITDAINAYQEHFPRELLNRPALFIDSQYLIPDSLIVSIKGPNSVDYSL